MNNNLLSPHFVSRRNFLGSSIISSLGLTSFLSAVSTLRPLNHLWAQDPGDDYKALVCVYLGGGNDGANVLVPTGSEYADYASIRGPAAALSEADLLSAGAVDGGRTFGMHPQFAADASTPAGQSSFQSLYADGKLAFVANVGPLVVPTSKQQYLDRSVPLPPQLLSHRDQTLHWQSSVTDRPFSTGWGGRVADLVSPLNGNADLSVSVSLASQNGFQVSSQPSTQPFRMTSAGTVVLAGFNGLDDEGNYLANDAGRRVQALDEMFGSPQGNLHGETYRQMFNGARQLNSLVGDSISTFTEPVDWPEFATDSLSRQMEIIAKMVAVRQDLGMKRQIFFCSLGGFDTHRSHLTSHDTLMQSVRRAMSSFYDATVALGMEDSVTSFTSSEFGRSYTANGTTAADGVDHAWGSQAMVLGGAVGGGMIYGTMPTQIPGGPDDTSNSENSRGRWIPTTSVDEFAATLGKWFGLGPEQTALAFPNLHRFNQPDLGFMG